MASTAAPKGELLLSSLRKFYDDQENAKLLADVLLRRRDGLSLRSLEKHVTHCGKRQSSAGKSPVYISYKAALHGYSKKYFDAFARSAKIPFHLPTGDVVHTTPAQLNFCRWAIRTGLITRKFSE